MEEQNASRSHVIVYDPRAKRVTRTWYGADSGICAVYIKHVSGEKSLGMVGKEGGRGSGKYLEWLDGGREGDDLGLVK